MTRNNECLIDWFRFTIPNSTAEQVAQNILGLPLSDFGSGSKGSPIQSYNHKFSFANIDIHISDKHNNVLVDLSGKGCRQYEEYLSRELGWHWQRFIKEVLSLGGTVTRIDLALDIFDSSSPCVSKLQDYIRRGQLSSRSRRYKQVNSGDVLTGALDGFTVYIGAKPQILRIYDKRAERIANDEEFPIVEQWIRWELELTDEKARTAAQKIADRVPLNMVIKGILSSHYAFKTQPKGKKDFHNKSRWPNMRWWNKFIEGIPEIPLRVRREKKTLAQKEGWLNSKVMKSLVMVTEPYRRCHGDDYAEVILKDMMAHGKSKLTDIDEALIEQRVNEMENEWEY